MHHLHFCGVETKGLGNALKAVQYRISGVLGRTTDSCRQEKSEMSMNGSISLAQVNSFM